MQPPGRRCDASLPGPSRGPHGPMGVLPPTPAPQGPRWPRRAVTYTTLRPGVARMYGDDCLTCGTVNKPMGRPRQPPSEATVKRMRDIAERLGRTEHAAQQLRNDLYIAAYNACVVDGASREEVAREMGVGKTTVQGWVNRGRQLRENG